MMKRTKKILLWVVSTIAVLFALLLIIPELFENQIAEIVKKEANKYLKAKLEFKEVDISMIRNFPRVSVSLRDVTIVGQKEFEADTLLVAGEVGAAINLMSIFGDEYEISKILVENTRVNTILGRSGAANWDIVKTDEELMAEGYEIDDTEVPLALELEDIEINNLTVLYDDRDANMFVSMRELNALCSGNMKGDITNLKIVGGSPSLTAKMMGVPLVEDVEVNVVMDTEIDLAKSKFTFRDNTIKLNAVETGVDGWVAMLEEGFDMDIRLKTETVSFKNLLSLVPGLYSNDFKKLNASGQAMLSAYARGLFAEESVPAFDVVLSVADAKFKYPDLPAGVDNINIVAKVANPGGSADATTIQLSPFTLQMAGQALSMTANIATPISDLTFDMGVVGQMDLSKLKDVYPMGDMALRGGVNADLKLQGRASYLTAGTLDKCVAQGSVSLKDFAFGDAAGDKLTIPVSTFTFTPAALRLSDTQIVMGGSDMTINASLENYLGYLFTGSTIKGKLNVNSNTINLDELLASAPTEDVAVEQGSSDTEVVVARVESIRVPENIDFDMQIGVKRIVMGQMNLRNLSGTLIVKDSKVDMKNLSINTMGGGVAVNGLYSTPTDKTALFDAGVRVNSLKVADIAKELGIDSPIVSAIAGSVSSHFNVDATLNGTTPDLGALNASGSLSVKNLGLPQLDMLATVADLLADEKLKNPKVEDFDIGFEIKNGVVSTKPVEIKVSGYTVRLEGQAKLDMTIDYKGTITAPSGRLAAMGPIPLTIKGTLTKPEIMVDMESIAKSAAQQVLSGLGGKLLGSDEKTESGDAKESVIELPEEVTEKITKVDSVAAAVQSAIEELPTKEEVVEQIKEQLPTKEEIEEQAKEQLKGAAMDFLKGLGGR